MCKYCKLKNLYGDKNEKSNDCKTLLRLNDGNYRFEISLNRYIYELENIHRSELMLDTYVKPFYDTNMIVVNSKSVKIKYCPFCGEEL